MSLLTSPESSLPTPPPLEEALVVASIAELKPNSSPFAPMPFLRKALPWLTAFVFADSVANVATTSEVSLEPAVGLIGSVALGLCLVRARVRRRRVNTF